MKRDLNLMRLILLGQRDEIQPPELKQYPEELVGYNAALLVDGGYIEGSPITDNNGQKTGAVLLQLTEAGHDLLEKLESDHSRPKPREGNMAVKQISVFISHSAKDLTVAAALVELLRGALNITASEIRCTSVNGYRLPGGADTDAALREEIQCSKAFIGIVTPNSIASAYVLFELGARWGANLHLLPVIAGGNSEVLRGPLKGLNALNCSDQGQVLQIVSDIGKELGLQPGGPESYEKKVGELVQAASSIKPAASERHPIADEPSGSPAHLGDAYEEREIAAGVFAYIKEDYAGTLESAKKFCSSCYDRNIKSTLQQSREPARRVGLTCGRCNAKLVFDCYKDSQPPEPPPPQFMVPSGRG